MNIEARIEKIMDEQVISDRFRKREFVVQTKEQYPQTLCFEFTQDKTSVLDAYQAGQEVNVEFNIRGREWTLRRVVLRVTIRRFKLGECLHYSKQLRRHLHQIYLQRVSHLPLVVTIAFLTTIYRSNSPKSWGAPLIHCTLLARTVGPFRIPIQLQIAKGSSPFRGI